MNAFDPREMVFDLDFDDLGLQGDDVRALDDIRVLGAGAWGREDRGEKGQEKLEREHVVDARECNCCDVSVFFLVSLMMMMLDSRDEEESLLIGSLYSS